MSDDFLCECFCRICCALCYLCCALLNEPEDQNRRSRASREGYERIREHNNPSEYPSVIVQTPLHSDLHKQKMFRRPLEAQKAQQIFPTVQLQDSSEGGQNPKIATQEENDAIRQAQIEEEIEKVGNGTLTFLQMSAHAQLAYLGFAPSC